MKRYWTSIKYIACIALGTCFLSFNAFAIEKQVNVNEFLSNYKFKEIKKTYTGVDLSTLQELSNITAEKILLNSIPTFLREKAKPYVKNILQSSARHQVDPLWVTAVIWTESHFNNNAVSPCFAIGLMQVMPETGMHMMKTKFGRKLTRKQQIELLKNPAYNIELGTIYLKDLLKRFKGDYRFATIAYNMGPGWVAKGLAQGRPVGQSHDYHIKVTRAYKNIERSYIAIVTKLANFKEYESSLIAMGQSAIDAHLAPLFSDVEKEILGVSKAQSM